MEITIEKGDGSTFSAEAGGNQRKSATIQVLKKKCCSYILLHNLSSCLFTRRCFAYIMDSDCYRWIFSSSNSREFRKTGKVVYSNFNLS